jgi:hypothetical protein
VYQEEMDHGRHTRKRRSLKMQTAYGYWRPHCHAAVSVGKGRTALVQTFIYSRIMYGAEVWDDTKAVKDKMSAVVKLSAAF